jgi:hypothetical protein
MIQRYHAAGILFSFVYENNEKWVLVGRRNTYPAIGKWSIPILRCSRLLCTENSCYDYKKTAMLASEKELGIVVDTENKLALLGVKNSLRYKIYIYSCNLNSSELPPMKNDFHMVMWSKVQNVPKPNTLFFRNLLQKFGKQQG